MARGHSPKKRLCECGHAKGFHRSANKPPAHGRTPASPNAAATPTNRRNHEEVLGSVPDRRLRVAARAPSTFISLTHTLRIDLLFGLRYF